MLRQRTLYAVIIAITIVTGLLVRLKKAWFPEIVNLYLGDVLYAFMMFYIVSFIVPNKALLYRSIIALVICYCIEFAQLYDAEWINCIRATLPGRLVLGSGFLWSDLLAYLIGIATASCIGKFVQIRPTRE